MFYRQYGKRIFDLFLVIPGIIIVSPVILIVALLVRIQLGSFVFFQQKRPGLNGKPFTIYKFRTMTEACTKDGKPLPDSDRLPRFGKLLRSTSMDELPELFNVLKGEMSLVGPRPLLMQYLDRYTQEHARRHEVKPGITGLAQIKGRNELSWPEKFDLDVKYVDSLSFFLDIKILSMTLWKILIREGINQKGQSTMEEFKGY